MEVQWGVGVGVCGRGVGGVGGAGLRCWWEECGRRAWDGVHQHGSAQFTGQLQTLFHIPKSFFSIIYNLSSLIGLNIICLLKVLYS